MKALFEKFYPPNYVGLQIEAQTKRNLSMPRR